MNNILCRLLLAILCVPGAAAPCRADDGTPLHAHYLANAGVMVSRGETKLLFDPFFRNDYGVYALVPADMEAAIMAGEPPYDGIDALFVSHYHDDHFDPALVLAYLEKWPEIEFYAPQQAIDIMLQEVDLPDMAILNRVHGLNLEAGGDAAEIRADELVIEAAQIAHAGWPSRNTEIDNVTFRVTIDDATTVLHLGDADKSAEHYEPQREYWQERKPRLAFAPVWLLLTEPGRNILDEFVGAEHVIGVHVYTRVPQDPADRPDDFDGLDLFTRPGETRELR